VELPLKMKFQSPDSQTTLLSPVLRSWKDIAQYVGACVKTVQRWEYAHGFPVQRLDPQKGAVVFALRDEVICRQKVCGSGNAPTNSTWKTYGCNSNSNDIRNGVTDREQIG
jgi:hypothetical protein